ncbi:RICIN domain-containing protein [Kineosporia babensis]|uniref:RICIN domain-containing protein n=1 Tax=Kineosporia babensis TaxID=499548 RepID=A0A9X1SY18_9ACTN|nr:RICIN domain-containing protein [Kineosporia babensis]
MSTAEGRRRRDSLLIRGGYALVAGGIALGLLTVLWLGDRPNDTRASLLSNPSSSTLDVEPRVLMQAAEPTGQAVSSDPVEQIDPAPETTLPTATTEPETPKEEDEQPPAKKEPKAARTSTSETFVVRNLHTGVCLDLPYYGVVDPATRLGQHPCTPGSKDNQDYQRVQVGGKFVLRNVRTGMCVDAAGTGAVDPGQDAIIYSCVLSDADNQFLKARTKDDGVQLFNPKMKMCLDVLVPDEGRRAVVWSKCSTAPTQIWQFRSQAD